MRLSDKSSWPRAELLRATQPIPLEDFAVSAPKLALALLGTVLVHGPTAGMIVETEAYLGTDDLAAHSVRGVTNRTQVIFGPPGRAYVYLIYGMYRCLNVVADAKGKAGCVLIRALDPLSGFRVMLERRKAKTVTPNLTNGPGKLTEALNITDDHYGKRLDRGPLAIRRWSNQPIFEVAITRRIGITQSADLPLRYVWAGHPFLSRSLSEWR